MAHFYQNDSIGQGILTAGQSIGQALAYRGQQNKIKEQNTKNSTILNSVIKALPPDPSFEEFQGALSEAMSKGVPIETIASYAKMYEPLFKEKAKVAGAENFYNKVIGQGQTDKMSPIEQTKAAMGAKDTEEMANSTNFNITTAPEENLMKLMLSPYKQHQDLAKAEIDRRQYSEKRIDNAWKDSRKTIDAIDENASEADFAIQVADEVQQLVKTNKISPTNIRNFAASQWGDRLPFLFSPETASLKFLEKLQAKSLKQYFPRPTEREFFFMNSAQAQLGKSNEANLAISDLQKKFSQIPIKIAEFKNQIIKENGNVPPRDLNAKIREKMENYKNTLFKDSAKISYEFGNESQKKEAADYLKLKPLTREIGLEFWKLSGQNEQIAKRLAEESGYDTRAFVK